jgi:hypothetical protein
VVVTSAVCIVYAAALALGMYFGLQSDNETPTASLDPPDPSRPIPSSDSELGVYWNAAVPPGGYPCAIIGRLVGRHSVMEWVLQHEVNH